MPGQFSTVVAAERRKHRDAIRAITDRARAAGRDHVTRAEDETIKALQDRIRALDLAESGEAETDRLMAELHPVTDAGRPSVDDPADRYRYRDTGERAAVRRSESYAQHPVVAEHAARRADIDRHVVGHYGGIGRMIRAMTTTSGSALVPTIWAADIIDRARNASRVIQAGAQVIPMGAKTVQIGRLTGDPSAAFRAEAAPITPSDPVFDNVTLDAKTMSVLVVGSLEWFQDADGVDDVVANAISQAMATQLDLVALFGGVTTGGEGISLATPPNPRGILATLLASAPSSVLGSATNGTAQTAATYFGELLDVVYTPQYYNETVNAVIGGAKLWRQYAGAADTTNQPLQMPADLANLTRLSSNQIPSFTQGTMTGRATDVFAGDFTQLLIGERLEITLQTLTERYAENGQVGIVAHWRGDVGLARPRAFAVYRYLQGAV